MNSTKGMMNRTKTISNKNKKTGRKSGLSLDGHLDTEVAPVLGKSFREAPIALTGI